MSAKNAILHSSITFRGKLSDTFGFNLDKWLAHELVNLEVLDELPECCPTNNLFIKNGFILPPNTRLGFNMNVYLRRILGRLDVTIGDYCCKEKELSITNGSVYYSNGLVQGVDLVKWLKGKLDEYEVTYDDSCC